MNVCLEHLVRIGEEGVSFKEFDTTPYVNAWASAKVTRPNQNKEKRKYTSRSSTTKIALDSSSGESDFYGFEDEDFEEGFNNMPDPKSKV